MTKTTKPKFRTQYTGNVRVPFSTKGESLTQQSFAEDAKIQNIVKKYDSQGFFDTINRNPAQYHDFSEVTDLQNAMEKIDEAHENFMTIPSTIRERFHNNAHEFYQFASDQNNFDELIDMGLATRTVAEEVSSPVVEETSSPPVAETNTAKEES